MWQTIQGLFSASSLAVARNVLMALAGVFIALGIVSATQAQDFVNKLMAVGTEIGVLMTAISAFIMVALPIFSAIAASVKNRIKAVSQQPHTFVVQTATADATVKAAAMVANMPNVEQVVTSPRVANAVPSDKVVAK